MKPQPATAAARSAAMVAGAHHPASASKVRLAAWITLGSFTIVLTAIEAMALRGQLDFGRHVLELHGAWLAIPPIALEGGTLVAATLTLWAVLSGDSAALPRLITATFIAACVYASYQGAQHAGRSTLAAEYLAGASAIAYLMWHAILTRIRRTGLHEVGAIDAPLPRFRLLRWLIAFSETSTALKIAVRHNITSPEQALALAKQPATNTSRETNPDRPHGEELTVLATRRGGKRRAVEHAATILGSTEPTRIQQWLAARGINVDLSYVSRTLARLDTNMAREITAPEHQTDERATDV
ncbi:hypothetical protein GCM10027176_51770 [Actinoallomurus bryophytorum]|uniref:DUF2637 domain-containing protein n=1 Tax=Actinoallomurus bryophytorum TaxID=1490222 RepID=A0A543CHM6_9ACTN|nr:hypothetical protein [Actinoallomurus bryophytorum]TQL96586.1 hypothetical protein FB559_2125 [Actinoallomurus bryophytorum]